MAAEAASSAEAPQLPSEWVAGPTRYYRLTHEGKPYAVLVGKTLNDRECSFAVRWDPNSRNHFFTNLATREKLWQLPQEVPPKPPSTTDPADRDGFRQRVAAIYRQYCPDKLHQVDLLLTEYGPGKEEACIAALVKKYGPEPPSAAAGQGQGGASDGKLSVAAPQAADIAAYTKRVRRFYEVYCPAKIDSASKQLLRYQGQEGALIDALIRKYGPEPEPLPADNAKAPSTATTRSNTPPEKQQQQPASDSSARRGTPSPPASNSSEPTTSSAQQATPPLQTVEATTVEPGRTDDTPRPTSPTSPRSTRKPSLAAAAAAVTNAVRAQSSSVALMEADNRERILVSFVQDREQRLAEAHQRYEVSAQALESLRKTNRDLVNEMESLRRSADQQISASRIAMDQLREETQISRNEWHRERQHLQSAVDDAAENSSKLLQHERLRLEEQAVKFIGEKAQLQADLHKAKQELDEQMQRSSDLIAVLDKKDKEHQRLLRHIDDLNRKIEGIARSTRSTQTDMMDAVKPMPDLAPHNGATVVHVPDARSVSYEGGGARVDAAVPGAAGHDSTLSAIEEFDRVMSTDKYRRAELETWKVKCMKLEKELHAIREQRGFPASSPCGGSGYGSGDCTNKLKSMRATIGALRNSNRVLEAKIAELELRLVAQPPIVQPTLIASPHESEVDSDVGRLREAARLLKNQLEDAQLLSRSQRKEIQELRGQLVSYMSASPHAMRR